MNTTAFLSQIKSVLKQHNYVPARYKRNKTDRSHDPIGQPGYYAVIGRMKVVIYFLGYKWQGADSRREYLGRYRAMLQKAGYVVHEVHQNPDQMHGSWLDVYPPGTVITASDKADHLYAEATFATDLHLDAHLVPVPVGFYYHYKGGIYYVHFTGFANDSNMQFVVYSGTKELRPGEARLRLVADWNTEVAWPDGITRKRFEKVKQ